MSQQYDRSTFYGIDTQQTRGSARQMDTNAEELGSMVSGISALLESTLWLGPGAQRFKSDWDGSMRPQMEQASDSLRANAAEMNRRADMQDAASA
jgi:hypothetical protein